MKNNIFIILYGSEFPMFSEKVWYEEMGTLIGLERKNVVLLKHSEEWGKLYQQERAILETLLEDQYILIQHVGSTSIPGLMAKPIIDIAVGVDSIEKMNNIKGILVDNGYHFRPDAGSDERLFLAKGGEESRTHYLHIEIFEGLSWNNHTNFRDYLICNPKCITEYENIKIELAAKYPNNREKYTLAKDEFIQSILKRYREQATNINGK